jgi:ATP-dependent Lon protease
MPTRLIPLFPLQLVVFPRVRVPLHIFEERYKKLVGDAIRDGSEFGIVFVRDDGMAGTGCSVKVDKVIEMYPDGRMDIMARGERRFVISRVDEEKDYLRAEVEYFDDDDLAPVAADDRTLALDNYRSLVNLGTARNHSDPDFEDPQVSFQIAQAVPDMDFLHHILRERSESERLRQLNQYLADYLPRQKTIERMKELAPTNGHGPKPTGL